MNAPAKSEVNPMKVLSGNYRKNITQFASWEQRDVTASQWVSASLTKTWIYKVWSELADIFPQVYAFFTWLPENNPSFVLQLYQIWISFELPFSRTSIEEYIYIYMVSGTDWSLTKTNCPIGYFFTIWKQTNKNIPSILNITFIFGICSPVFRPRHWCLHSFRY